MVLPDGSGTESERPRVGRRTLIILAFLAVAAGFLALGSLSGAEPEAIEVPTTTTTTTTTVADIDVPIDLENFSLEQIETGPQLDWSRVAEIPGAMPQSLIAHRDSVYVFAPATSEYAGLDAWRSENGVDWESLGTVIGPMHSISSIASTSLGLIAIEPDANDDYIHVWGSFDGTRWLEIADGIPVSGNGTDVDFYPSAIAADERILAIAGHSQPDVTELAEAYLAETTGTDVDLAGLQLGWISSPEDLYMTIYGPFNFPAARISGTELGLTAEQREEISSYFLGQPNDATIWTKAGDGAWQMGAIEGASFINTLAQDDDGTLRAFGYGYVPGSWFWHDGSRWEKINDADAPSRVETWGSRMVGIGDSGVNPDVLLSSDGQTWNDSGLAAEFPSGILWYPLGFATGEGGIAAVIETQVDRMPRGTPETASLTDGDTTLTLDLPRGVVHLDTIDGLFTWSIGTGDVAGIDIDLASRELSFLHPTVGETLARFTFDELYGLEARTYVAGDRSGVGTGLTFSPDGSDWTVQNLTPEFGPDAFVTHVEVTDERVLVLASRLPEWGRPYGVEGFEIWSAPIP